MFIFLSFLGVLLFLIFNFLIATEFANIADAKGYNGTKYGVYTFFFGIAGMLMVVALPQRQHNSYTPKVTTHIKANAPTDKSKKVPPASNTKESFVEDLDIENADNFIDTVCAQCGKEISVYAGQEILRCPWCYTELDIKR